MMWKSIVPLFRFRPVREMDKEIKKVTILSCKFLQKVGTQCPGGCKGQRKARRSSLKRWWWSPILQCGSVVTSQKGERIREEQVWSDGQLGSSGMHLRIYKEFWDVLSWSWEWAGQGWTQLDIRQREAPGSWDVMLGLCISPKPKVANLPESWGKEGVGTWWSLLQTEQLCFDLFHLNFLRSGLKNRYHCWMSEGRHGVNTGALVLWSCWRIVSEGEKMRKQWAGAWELFSEAPVKVAYVLTIASQFSSPPASQPASQPMGASPAGKSLWWSQKQPLLMKLFLSGINIQEAITKHLLAGFVLVTPNVMLPRKCYLLKGKEHRTMQPL